MSQNLKKTENSLVRTFLIGAFVFLLVFETFFAISRHLWEKTNKERNFVQITNNYFSGRPIDKNFRPLFGAIFTDNE